VCAVLSNCVVAGLLGFMVGCGLVGCVWVGWCGCLVFCLIGLDPNSTHRTQLSDGGPRKSLLWNKRRGLGFLP
jgi:hypothetical protein